VKVLVIHGPNLNLLGSREPEIYGKLTLDEIDAKIRAHAAARGVSVVIHQFNGEGQIVDAIQNFAKKGSPEECDAMLINAGAFTHYSLAISDAIRSTGIPAIEVHLSNIYAREEFRRKSVIAPVCRGQIVGLGFRGYLLGLDAAIDLVQAE
jgi:3-dehydroquinate dehydratase-2